MFLRENYGAWGRIRKREVLFKKAADDIVTRARDIQDIMSLNAPTDEISNDDGENVVEIL